MVPMGTHKRTFRFWLVPLAIPLWLVGWVFFWMDAKGQSENATKEVQ